MINTILSRVQIGFPKRMEDWVKSPAIFSNHTLKIAGHPVMEDWEKGYMEKLAEIATLNGGNVLELGYGLGLSANAIQSHEIKNHYVIECHPDVITKGVKDQYKAISENKFHILGGFWQDVTPLFADETFDGILFDTYPLKEEEIHSNHFWFFEEAFRLLKPGGMLTYYSDEVTSLSPIHIEKLKEAGFKEEDVKYEIVDVNPPEDCEYWQSKTILAPIIKKPA